MPLMIVESPNKIKKIKKSLPPDFVVMASFGHIMDLEKKNMGIDLKTFDATYKVSPDKKDVVKALKEEAKNHDIIYVATDPDREGEGIAHNLLSILPKKGKKIERVVFNKLTKPAIQAAIKNPVGFDYNLFAAQQARRMSDRMVGFKVSPVMWAKGMKNTSAGRVQSATLKWLVDREKEIRNFKVEEYWTIHADMTKNFTADLYGVNGKKFVPKSETQSKEIMSDVDDVLEVTSYDAKPRKRSPAAPFITATLQQDASSKMGWSNKRTMDVAQSIFSMGLISYHRTDSVRIDLAKINDIRDKAEQAYGKKFLSPKPRVYKNKDASQDAHEAIHPTFEPIPSSASVDERKLLKLITDRFMASQMADAIFDQTKVVLESKGGKKKYQFRASGSVLQFEGFLKVYGSATKDVALPPLKKGDKLGVKKLRPVQHFTKPPPRFSEAAFTNKMKVDNVGRPSTYVSVVETLLRHGYVVKEKKMLKPTEIGMMVSDYLSEFFADVTNAEYTAKLETELDSIASGQVDMKKTMTDFWALLSKEIDAAKKGTPGDIFKTDRDCPTCNDDSKMVRKVGKNGVFLGCENYPKCGHVMNFDDEGNIVDSHVETSEPCPECNSKITKKKGPRGEFWGCTAYPICKWTASVGPNGEIVKKKKAKLTKHKCPLCSSSMVEREGRNGKFLGCSNYPKCKSTANLDENGNMVVSNKKGKAKAKAEDTGIQCPKCKKGTLLKRKGKFGEFLGCSTFPKCKHIHKEK